MPFAVVGSNQIIEVKGRKVRGRMYPWGVVEVENPEHCDFIKLRTMLITHMQDLQEVTHEVHYENFRSERLSTTEGGDERDAGRKREVQPNRKQAQPAAAARAVNGGAADKENALAEKEAELRRMQEMVAQMQAQMAAQQKGGIPNGGSQAV